MIPTSKQTLWQLFDGSEHSLFVGFSLIVIKQQTPINHHFSLSDQTWLCIYTFLTVKRTALYRVTKYKQINSDSQRQTPIGFQILLLLCNWLLWVIELRIYRLERPRHCWWKCNIVIFETRWSFILLWKRRGYALLDKLGGVSIYIND